MIKHFSVARDQILILFFLFSYFSTVGEIQLNNLISVAKPYHFFPYLQMMWKPAYDFLYTWAAHYGDSYRDVLQDLQSALDKMKNPVTKQWRELTGTLILVNCMEVLRASAFSKIEEEEQTTKYGFGNFPGNCTVIYASSMVPEQG